MFYDPGCSGRVLLGPLPSQVRERLAALPGEWLEYDSDAGAIVVRHVQPTAGASLPTIAQELVAMLAEVPVTLRRAIAGGDLQVHIDGTQELVRLRVEPGGSLHVRWAEPAYERAEREAWQRGRHQLVESKVQRLDGELSLVTAEPEKAARQIQRVADTFEGLYPEGEVTVAVAAGTVTVTLHEVNLDVELLVSTLLRWAAPRTLSGHVDVSSFAGEAPGHDARFAFEEGGVWVLRPVLWPSEA